MFDFLIVFIYNFYYQNNISFKVFKVFKVIINKIKDYQLINFLYKIITLNYKNDQKDIQFKINNKSYINIFINSKIDFFKKLKKKFKQF